jgi:anti-sigma factor ChrR (cupin superfamily)
MTSGHTLEEGRERAALYALGALPGEEAREFDQHLAEGCDICRTEVAAFALVVAELGYAAPAHMPRPEVRARLLDRIAAQGLTQERPVIDTELLHFVGSAWLPWQPANAPGVEVKVLSLDKERGYYTTLVSMAPGASLAPHRHVDAEESYILQGELLVSGVLMRPGDHCHAEPGSMHTGVTTKTGCIFIAFASIRDEWLT